MPESPRSTAAKIAALTKWAGSDPVEGTRAARSAFRDSFRRKVLEGADAAGEILAEGEINRRAEALRRAHMLRMSLASAKSRRARAGRS